MTKTAAAIFVALVVLLCVAIGAPRSPGTPVGYFESPRVVTESAVSRALLDEPNQHLQQAREVAERARGEFARADETTAAAKLDAAKRAEAALDEAVRLRNVAGKTLDDRIAVVVARLSSPRKMTLVLGVSGKPSYASPDADLTAAVIEGLDGGASELSRARGVANAALAKVQQLEAAEAAKPQGARSQK